jgi:5'-methylthioadenosine phosphorylase
VASDHQGASSQTMTNVLAVIGGSGIYGFPGLTDVHTLDLQTPFGVPSSVIVRGRLGGSTILFLARHGDNHQIPPHQINYRANICALKLAGATHVISLSAVGSMRESIHPMDVVIVSDYVDLTRTRASTFFDSGAVAHVPMSPSNCPVLARAATNAAAAAGARVHEQGTYVCIEGPQFSTRAESFVYRSWGVDVIGMTAMPEAKLAREAELPYCTIAFVTDYDCWHETEAAVSVDVVLSTLKKNAELAPRIIQTLLGMLPDRTTSPAFGTLKHSIVTDLGRLDDAALSRIGWLLDTHRE